MEFAVAHGFCLLLTTAYVAVLRVGVRGLRHEPDVIKTRIRRATFLTFIAMLITSIFLAWSRTNPTTGVSCLPILLSCGHFV